MPQRNKRLRKLRSPYVWHRTVGIVTALFVIVLAASGIALNHTTALRLDQRQVHAPWLLDHYGLSAPSPVSYRVGTHAVTQLGHRLYFDHTEIATDVSRYLGATALPTMIVIAADARLLLLTLDGQRIEILDATSGLPTGIEWLSVHDGQLIVHTPHGDYRADNTLLSWTPHRGPAVTRITPTPLPTPLRDALLHQYRGTDLTWERVMLDLHSGRLWGHWGPWLMDGSALLMSFLAGSGIWMWFKGRRARGNGD